MDKYILGVIRMALKARAGLLGAVARTLPGDDEIIVKDAPAGCALYKYRLCVQVRALSLSPASAGRQAGGGGQANGSWKPVAGMRCPAGRPAAGRSAPAQRPPWRHDAHRRPAQGPVPQIARRLSAGLRCPAGAQRSARQESRAAAAGFCGPPFLPPSRLPALPARHAAGPGRSAPRQKRRRRRRRGGTGGGRHLAGLAARSGRCRLGNGRRLRRPALRRGGGGREGGAPERSPRTPAPRRAAPRRAAPRT